MFVKLFEAILDSTVWQLLASAKVVWITLLLTADDTGFVATSVPGLARRADVTRGECESALAAFMAPDPDSRTKDYEGRRIEPRDGGFFVLNYTKYRSIRNQEDRREYERVRKREQRAGAKQTEAAMSGTVPDSAGQPEGVHDVPPGPALSAQSEAEADGGGGEPAAAAIDAFRRERDRACAAGKDVDVSEVDIGELSAAVLKRSPAQQALLPRVFELFFQREGKSANDTPYWKRGRWSMHILALQGIGHLLPEIERREREAAALQEKVGREAAAKAESRRTCPRSWQLHDKEEVAWRALLDSLDLPAKTRPADQHRAVEAYLTAQNGKAAQSGKAA